MTKTELKQALLEKGIPAPSFSVEGLKSGECMCLIEKEGNYSVVYNSRGKVFAIDTFKSEDAACKFMFTEILKEYHGLK